MNTAGEILARALELPEPDRAELARQLLLSLEPNDFDPDSEVLWAAEIEARLNAIERGNFAARDWQEAITRLRQSLAQGKGS